MTAKIKEKELVCTKCFNTLGIDSRMRIYRFLLENGENTVNSVVEVVKLTQPTVSYHLKEMKNAGLLNSRKSGKEVFYYINGNCPTLDDECVVHKVTFPSRSVQRSKK